MVRCAGNKERSANAPYLPKDNYNKPFTSFLQTICSSRPIFGAGFS